MAIEYLQPIRSEYDSEIEYASALLESVRVYKQKLFAAIDRTAAKSQASIRIEAKPKRSYATVHDFLSERPELLRRYKEIGAAALLELH